MNRRRLEAILRPIPASLLEILFPTRCAACGSPGAIWCAECRNRVVRPEGRVCLACGRILTRSSARHRCSSSTSWAVAGARYQYPVDRLLTYLKYRPDERLARALAVCMEEALRESSAVFTCIVPVPLGAKRERQRGYNQAELLGRALARSMLRPLVPRAAARVRETASQVGLDPVARRSNVAGAFRGDPDLVRGHSILLVDDVHTTGATLASCAEALLLAGADDVVGATVARA
ncbi:MAG TPA: double zinc ribbon domain-containing protein [Anaerolineales bacterium]|nr:double zinc ribbon domain-containing protein [Anaerolineales bacterium]